MKNLLVLLLFAAGCLLSAGAEKSSVLCPHTLFGPVPEPTNPNFRKDDLLTEYSCTRGLSLDTSKMSSTGKTNRPRTQQGLSDDETSNDDSDSRTQPDPQDQRTNLAHTEPDDAHDRSLLSQPAQRDGIPHLGRATEGLGQSVSSLEEQQNAPADQKNGKEHAFDEEGIHAERDQQGPAFHQDSERKKTSLEESVDDIPHVEPRQKDSSASKREPDERSFFQEGYYDPSSHRDPVWKMLDERVDVSHIDPEQQESSTTRGGPQEARTLHEEGFVEPERDLPSHQDPVWKMLDEPEHQESSASRAGSQEAKTVPEDVYVEQEQRDPPSHQDPVKKIAPLKSIYDGVLRIKSDPQDSSASKQERKEGRPSLQKGLHDESKSRDATSHQDPIWEMLSLDKKLDEKLDEILRIQPEHQGSSTSRGEPQEGRTARDKRFHPDAEQEDTLSRQNSKSKSSSPNESLNKNIEPKQESSEVSKREPERPLPEDGIQDIFVPGSALHPSLTPKKSENDNLFSHDSCFNRLSKGSDASPNHKNVTKPLLERNSEDDLKREGTQQERPSAQESEERKMSLGQGFDERWNQESGKPDQPSIQSQADSKLLPEEGFDRRPLNAGSAQQGASLSNEPPEKPPRFLVESRFKLTNPEPSIWQPSSNQEQEKKNPSLLAKPFDTHLNATPEQQGNPTDKEALNNTHSLVFKRIRPSLNSELDRDLNHEPKDEKTLQGKAYVKSPNTVREQRDDLTKHDAKKTNPLLKEGVNQYYNATLTKLNPPPNHESGKNNSLFSEEGLKDLDSEHDLLDSRPKKTPKDEQPLYEAGLANLLDPEPTKPDSSSNKNQDTKTQDKSHLVEGLDEILNAMLLRRQQFEKQNENPSSLGDGFSKLMNTPTHPVSTPDKMKSSSLGKNFGNLTNITAEQRELSSNQEPEVNHLLEESPNKSSKKNNEQPTLKQEPEKNKSLFEGSLSETPGDTSNQQNQLSKHRHGKKKSSALKEEVSIFLKDTNHDNHDRLSNQNLEEQKPQNAIQKCSPEEKSDLSSDKNTPDRKPLFDSSSGDPLNTTIKHIDPFSHHETGRNIPLNESKLDRPVAASAEQSDPPPNKKTEGENPSVEDTSDGISNANKEQKSLFTKYESKIWKPLVLPRDLSKDINTANEKKEVPSIMNSEEPLNEEKLDKPPHASIEQQTPPLTPILGSNKPSTILGDKNGHAERQIPLSNPELKENEFSPMETLDKPLIITTEHRDPFSTKGPESNKTLELSGDLKNDQTKQTGLISNQQPQENNFFSTKKLGQLPSDATNHPDPASIQEPQSYKPPSFSGGLSKDKIEQKDRVSSQESLENKYSIKENQPDKVVTDQQDPEPQSIKYSTIFGVRGDFPKDNIDQNDSVLNQENKHLVNEKLDPPLKAATDQQDPASNSLTQSIKPSAPWVDLKKVKSEEKRDQTPNAVTKRRSLSSTEESESNTDFTPRENSRNRLATQRDAISNQEPGEKRPLAGDHFIKSPYVTQLLKNQDVSTTQGQENSKFLSQWGHSSNDLTEPKDPVSSHDVKGEKDLISENSDNRMNENRQRDLTSSKKQVTKILDEGSAYKTSETTIDKTESVSGQKPKEEKPIASKRLGRIHRTTSNQRGFSQNEDPQETKSVSEALGKSSELPSMTDIPTDLKSDLSLSLDGDDNDPLVSKMLTSNIIKPETNSTTSREHTSNKPLHHVRSTQLDPPPENKEKSRPLEKSNGKVSNTRLAQSNLSSDGKKEVNNLPAEDELDRLLKMAKAEKLEKSSKAPPPERIPKQSDAKDEVGKRKSTGDTQSTRSDNPNTAHEIPTERRQNPSEDELQGIVTYATTPIPSQGDSHIPGDMIITDDIVIPAGNLIEEPESNIVTIAFTADTGSVVDVVYPSRISIPTDNDARTDEFEPALNIGSQPKVSVSSYSDKTSILSFPERTTPVNNPLEIRTASPSVRASPHIDEQTPESADDAQTTQDRQSPRKGITVNRRPKQQ